MLIERPEDLGAIVREARLAMGLTQDELARRAGVSRPTLVRIETGHPRPELDVVLRILAALDLVVDVAQAPPAGFDIDALIERTKDTGLGRPVRMVHIEPQRSRRRGDQRHG